MLHEPSHAALAGAIEGNLQAWLLNFARLPGGQLHEEPQVTWYITGHQSELLNGVVRTQIDSLEEAAIDAEVAKVLDPFRTRAVRMCWWTGPSTSPSDLDRYLLKQSLRQVFDSPGMATDLRELFNRTGGAVPDGVAVSRVEDVASLSIWLDAGQQSPSPEPVRARGLEVNALLALAPEAPLQHYVGWLHGKPVAKSTLFLGAGVAGIYNVLVQPEARRRGIGTVMTVAPLWAAQALGYRIGVLCSSAMAVDLYWKLGFREFTRLQMYAGDFRVAAPAHEAATPDPVAG